MTDRLRKEHRFSTVPEHLIRDRTITDRAVRLWCLLDRYAGANGEAFPLRRTLGDNLSCSLASVDRAIAELVDSGWLSKERRERGGPNEYTLLVAPVKPLDARRARRRASTPSVSGEDTPDRTGEDTPVVTHDDTLPSQETTGVVMGDAQKEASSKDPSGKDSGDTSPGRRRPKTPLPDDFAVTEEMKAWFEQQPWAANVARPGIETQNFMDHHRAKDSRFSDWVAAWRTWMRNAGNRYADNVRPLDTRHRAQAAPESTAARVADLDGRN